MAERDAALGVLMSIPGSRRLSVGADKGYDAQDFVAECRDLLSDLLTLPARLMARGSEEEMVRDRWTNHAP